MNSLHPSAASGPWWVLLNPSGSVQDKTIPKFTAEEKSSELFEVKPDGERSPTSHSSCKLRNLLISEAISNSLKSSVSVPLVTRLPPYGHQTGFVCGGLSADV